MEIIEVNSNEFSNIIQPFHKYGSVSFNELNKNKCDELFYLLFRDNKFRLGIIGGLSENVLFSPFSAPFGGFSYTTRDLRIQYLEEAIDQLSEWASLKHLDGIGITLPSIFYETNFITKQINALWRKGFLISKIELNHSFNLSNFDRQPHEYLWHNARKNLRIALNSGIQFVICTTDEEKEKAYDIISINRRLRGHQLKMTWSQVLATTKVLDADFFLAISELNEPIASAIVFHVTDLIVQVIYWGDNGNFHEIRPMNFLAFKIFEYYKAKNFEIVDIGYSSENSVPNYGLCEFKESIGCQAYPKYSLFKKVK